jgi:hypothetical protein
VSAASFPRRLAVFAAFAALAAAGAFALRPPAPGAGPSSADLEALEAVMVAGARLHPALQKVEAAGSAAFCAGCHPPPPHTGNRVADAMTNDHAGRMDCLVCHWSASSAGARPAPVWQVQAGSAFLAALPAERSSKERLAALRSTVTAGGRRCFERGPGCGQCHRPGGMGALTRPGAAPQRTAALESLENYFTLAPGEKWYFPQLQ